MVIGGVFLVVFEFSGELYFAGGAARIWKMFFSAPLRSGVSSKVRTAAVTPDCNVSTESFAVVDFGRRNVFSFFAGLINDIEFFSNSTAYPFGARIDMPSVDRAKESSGMEWTDSRNSSFITSMSLNAKASTVNRFVVFAERLKNGMAMHMKTETIETVTSTSMRV